MGNWTRLITGLLIAAGLVMIAVGSVLAYPFVHDLVISQNASAYDFSVTPPSGTSALAAPAPAEPPTGTDAGSDGMVVPVLTPTPSSAPNAGAAGEAKRSTATASPTPTRPALPPDRIVISAIKLDAPVVPVGWHTETTGGVSASVWDVPDERAAGWLKTSAAAGQVGNTVLDGHHNINGEVFRYLVDLKPGDEIDLYAGGTEYRYAVTERHILPDKYEPIAVREQNARWIAPTQDDRLTLVTCWPYTNNTHRLIIVAAPILSQMPN